MTSGQFHHIDIYARSHLRVEERPSARPSHLGEARPDFSAHAIQWKVCMFIEEKSSGVEAPRKKITSLAPAPFRGSKRTRIGGTAPDRGQQ
jgi:hypothetical protein